MTRVRSLRHAAWSLVWTRAVVLAAGLGAGAVRTDRVPLDPTGLTAPFGSVGNAFLAPFARFDSVELLAIAHGGYSVRALTPFYPVYPSLAALVGAVVGSAAVAGIVVSLAGMLAGLWAVHRLVLLDTGDARTADLTVTLLACFPMAFFLSAVYSEGLFLGLSASALLAARTDRWALAGLLGAGAAATRPVGLAVAAALVVLAAAAPTSGLRVRRLAWTALVPLGLAAFAIVLAASGRGALAFMAAEGDAGRHFAGPFVGILYGIVAPLNHPSAVFELPYLAFAIIATIGVLRILPPAYGAYVVASLAVPLSFPADEFPLTSLSRFVAVLFPLHLWIALRLVVHPRATRVAIAASTAAMALYVAQFSTWRFVS